MGVRLLGPRPDPLEAKGIEHRKGPLAHDGHPTARFLEMGARKVGSPLGFKVVA
jgi:hypothetical protein